jgi:hypothetical protein
MIVGGHGYALIIIDETDHLTTGDRPAS